MNSLFQLVFRPGRIIRDPLIYSTGAEFTILGDDERFTVTFTDKGGEIGLRTDGHSDRYWGDCSRHYHKWDKAMRRVLRDGSRIKWSVFTDGFKEGWRYYPGGIQFCVEDPEGEETGQITIYEGTLIEIKSNAFFRNETFDFIQDMKSWNWEEAKRQVEAGQLPRDSYERLLNRMREG